MRIGLSALGVAMAIAGLLGAAEATGLLGPGVGLGDKLWFRGGLACFIAGIATLTLANRRSL